MISKRAWLHPSRAATSACAAIWTTSAARERATSSRGGIVFIYCIASFVSQACVSDCALTLKIMMILKRTTKTKQAAGWTGSEWREKRRCDKMFSPPSWLFALLTCVGASCTGYAEDSTALRDKSAANGWTTRRTAGDGGGCCRHHPGERSWEQAGPRKELSELPGHVRRLLSELRQSRAQTSTVSALFLQEMPACTLKESGHDRATRFPSWRGDQTMWVTTLTNNDHESICKTIVVAVFTHIGWFFLS